MLYYWTSRHVYREMSCKVWLTFILVLNWPSLRLQLKKQQKQQEKNTKKRDTWRNQIRIRGTNISKNLIVFLFFPPLTLTFILPFALWSQPSLSLTWSCVSLTVSFVSAKQRSWRRNCKCRCRTSSSPVLQKTVKRKKVERRKEEKDPGRQQTTWTTTTVMPIIIVITNPLFFQERKIKRPQDSHSCVSHVTTSFESLVCSHLYLSLSLSFTQECILIKHFVSICQDLTQSSQKGNE